MNNLSEDPDEMLQNATFNQGLDCFQDKNNLQGTEVQLNLEILIYDHFVCTMYHTRLNISDTRMKKKC